MTLDPSSLRSREEIADLERIAKAIPEIPPDFKDLRELLGTIRKPVSPLMRTAREGDLPEDFGGKPLALSLVGDQALGNIDGNFGGPLRVGSVFPTNPTNNDLFYRTDIGVMCTWSSFLSRWLSVHLETLHFATQNALLAPSTAHTFFCALPQRDIYLQDTPGAAFITIGNNATDFWTVTFAGRTSAGATTTLGSYTTIGDGANLWNAKAINVSLFLTNAYTEIDASVSPTGAPGPIYVTAMGRYRIAPL